jgi:hypothetical protein
VKDSKQGKGYGQEEYANHSAISQGESAGKGSDGKSYADHGS